MSTIIIAGGTGLLGMNMSKILTEKGYEVRHLSRRRNLNAPYPAYAWNLNNQTIDEDVFQNVDYVINLAGANIGGKRWTKRQKQLIIESRTQSTQLLRDSIEKLPKKPKAFISASAVGIYGDRGNEMLSEESSSGTGFVPEVVKEWEKAIDKVTQTGIRTVALRIGIVLSTKGGALEKMLLPFKLMNGSWFGNGAQYYSWIHIDDVTQLFIKAIEDEKMHGVYNAVSPNPETCKNLVIQIKKALNSPAILMPVPSFALKIGMGEMAVIVMDSTRVSSQKIEDTGFKFQFPELLPALKDLIKRKI
ncbi:MAG: TIGR01777 family oxidoreductase [Bacteroidetes bacterium]|jgi:uncharacterized protein (TIGR01777 family)|nr:TIGR01777 family oxidoreductase [Bacteroidota bacterium]MDF1867279.1 TIGR01777 family oxidoreductase [Saprospiraceae bacterium]